jgi:3-oxoacyl-[acyl-carrier protein] reductase
VREGAAVTICARGRERLDEAADEIIAICGDEDQVLVVEADLTQTEDVRRVVEATLIRWDRVDIAVNNIGGPPAGPAFSMSDEQWRAALDLSFFSAVRMSREVVPSMRDHGWGRIVNVLSLSIRQPEENLALSTVARSATAAYTKCLSDELAADGITVNSVLPSSVETERLRQVAEMQARLHGVDPALAMEERLSQVPVGRLGRPDEIADLICFIASTRAGYLTGLSFPFDGGRLRSIQ